MSLLDSLYQELILEHYKRPRNRHALEQATLQQEGINPSCGDELELYLVIDENIISDIAFIGEGCAISQAATSMMTEAVKGRTVSEAKARAQEFRAMIHGDPPADALGDLKVLAGIAKLPARVKCATLAWVTLEQALANLNEPN
jgi:nitrogen fixation protein NifU and related proteins